MLDPKILANSIVSLSNPLTLFLSAFLESLNSPSQNLFSLADFKV